MASSSESSSPGSGKEEEAIYCICRSTDVSRFMIGCDHCEDWFHGDCVRVTERESKYIKKYYCKECRRKNPTLSVVYKSSYKEYLEKKEREKRIEKYKEKSREERHGHHKEKKKDKKRDRDEKEKKRDRERDKDRDKDRERRKEKEREERRKRKEAAKDKEKQQKPKVEVKDEVKAEVKVELADKKPEVKVKAEPESKPEPKPPQPAPTAPPTPRATERTSSTESKQKKATPLPPKKAILKEKNYLSDSETDDDDGGNAARPKNFGGEDGESDSEDAWEPPQVAVSKPAVAAKAQSKKRTKPMPAAPKASKKRRGRRESSSDDDQEPALSAPIHCYGPKCTKSSRPGSKYCSDQCGINLASMRIYQTLPVRINQWNRTPCEAEKKNKEELKKIREKQEEVQTRINQLMVDFRNLERVIEKGKEQTINEDDDEDEDSSAEVTVQCVTCGSDVAARTAVRHMERCYNKIESQTSFASRYKTQIDDVRMFCDFYNRKEQTYCKRLMVLCPEHHPDPRPDDREVCGYPLSKELLGKPSQFCLRAKKNCQLHFCWEKLRRAEIDMERVKQWMRVDELIEQERQVKQSMSNRSGVLGLMLHSTTDHDLDGRWQAQRKALHNAQRKHGQQKP